MVPHLISFECGLRPIYIYYILDDCIQDFFKIHAQKSMKKSALFM